MLSSLSFIRRNGKRKRTKVNGSQPHQQSSSVSSSLVSSSVFDINEETSSLSAAQCSRLAELDISVSDGEWFPQELLRRSTIFPKSSQAPLCAQNATENQNNSAKETRSDSPSVPPLSRSENMSPGVVFRKKSIPAPIFIPGAELLMPNVQVEHSAVPTQVPPLELSQSNANHTSLNPPSPSTSDNLSAISGTSLARDLIASTFMLASERRSSRHRSGIARQDSATLPYGIYDSGSSSPIPPVPPVPAILLPSKPSPHVAIESSASTESEYPVSDAYTTSSEVVISSAIPRPTSRTQEIPPPIASAAAKIPFSAAPNTTPQRKLNPVPARTRAVKYGVFDVPVTAVEVALPINSRETKRRSSHESSSLLSPDDHNLDDFDFVPLEPRMSIFSPDSDSSASYVMPLPKRSDTNREHREPKVDGPNHVRNSSKHNSLTGGISDSHQSNGIPSATMSEHDYGELLNYDLTVRPTSGTSSRIPSSISTGYQTFPETPMVSPPFWSSGYAVVAKFDSQALRTSSPKSARGGSGKLHCGTRTARRQLRNSDTTGRAVVSHRPQISLLPGQKTSPPKRAGSNLSPSAHVNDEARILDETNQPITVESQNSVELRSPVRAHPLAHISSSSSCLGEEEALQVLAPRSASSLPSIVADDVHDLPSSMADPAFVVDPSVESPTSVPLPESTDESLFNSPALTDSVTAISPLTGPLQSPIPTTASTCISQPQSSKFSSSAPLGASSFSPQSPASLNESFPFSPVPAVCSIEQPASPSPSFVPPPPYHSIVSMRTAHPPSSGYTSSLSRTSSAEPVYQRSRQASNSSAVSGSLRSHVRTRPPLPIGPRKPSGPGKVGTFASVALGRNASISSTGSGGGHCTGSPGLPWRKLQSAVSSPPPKFQPPPPKFCGLTLEAAQWTFTSTQLREIVSRAIQQSSEGSSLRLLRLEVVEGEIADQRDRLELQHTDVKAQYKALVRKRWMLMGALAGHFEGVEMNDASMASRTIEELAEVSLALDHLVDKMHGIALELAQLKSLCDVHNMSALAMAVRKINDLFVRQMAEKERLEGQVGTLQTERDEAWKHAEDVAKDYDTLKDRLSESALACPSGDGRENVDAQSLAGSSSRRSTHISAARKSSFRLSQAGLRSRRKRRPSRSSINATRPTSLALDIPPVPPVPPLPVLSSSIGSATFPIPSGGSMYSSFSGTSEALALVEAQREVYEMLGLSLPPSQASSRRRTLSGPDHPRSPSLNSRPASESLDTLAQERRRGRCCEDWSGAIKIKSVAHPTNRASL